MRLHSGQMYIQLIEVQVVVYILNNLQINSLLIAFHFQQYYGQQVPHWSNDFIMIRDLHFLSLVIYQLSYKLISSCLVFFLYAILFLND